MKKDIARRASVNLCFDGVDITTDISKYLLSVSYTDCEENEADDLQIKLADRDGVWLTQWLGQAIQASLVSTESGSVGSENYRVTAKIGLNVRSGPGMNYSKIGALAFGATAKVVSIDNGWAKLNYNGADAYAYAQYLSPMDATATAEESVGFKISATICLNHGDGRAEFLDCGQFELDDVTADGPPSGITIKATALPYTSSVRQTKKTQAWEAYTLRGISEEIARRNGMACLFDVEQDIYYERVEQFKESDVEFLQRLCSMSGISLKASNNMLVLFDQQIYDRKEAVRIIKRSECELTKYKLKAGKNEKEYSSCRVSYTTPSGTLITATAYVDDYDSNKRTNQQLEITAKVNSIAEAQRLASKQLRLHNKYAKTASLTVPGDPSLMAGTTVLLSGWGYWDGKYVVKKAKHSISNGYTTTADLRLAMEG